MRTKRLVSVCVFLLFLSITFPGFGSNIVSGSRDFASARRQQLRQRHSHNLSQQVQQQRALRATTRSARSLSLSAQPRVTASQAMNRIGLLAATQIPTGYKAWGFAKPGDFNGDGNKDVVTDVYDPNTDQTFFSVVLGNGNGTFRTAKLTPIANDGTLYVADLNGDHKDDVIITNGSSADVYLSAGDGTFATPVSFSTGGTEAVGASILDLNGDNIPDLMVVDRNSQVITLLGNGDGTFQAPTTVSYSGSLDGNGWHTERVIVADLNGDGKPDFAGPDLSTGQVAVYLADVSGGFQGPALLASDISRAPYNLVAGDLNGDGKPELIASSNDYITSNLTIYTNSGAGTFSNGVSQWVGFLTDGVAVADINGDGKNDIVAANDYGADITVLLGNGDGTVQAPTVGYAVGGYPFVNPVLADFNGDGKLDVIIPDYEFGLAYLQGYGDGTFRAAQNYFSPLPTTDTSEPWSISLASGDFNGDGTPDVVVGNCCNTEVGVTVFLGKPDGSLQPGVNYGTGDLEYVAVGDFDGDGKQDFAATSSSDNLIHVFRGNGDGTFQPDVTYGSGSYQPQGIVAVDLNKDGKQDLAVMTSDGYAVVLLNDGQGGFLPEVTYSLQGGGYQLAAADLNGDGNVDLVATDSYNNSIEVLLGDGDGAFQSGQAFAVGEFPVAVAIADVNGDEKPDVIVTSDNDVNIAVLLGNGDGSFHAPVFYPATLQDTSIDTPEPWEIRTVDLDADGKLDLVWVNMEYGTVGVLYGNGDGTFSGPIEFPTGGYPWGLITADMNGDGAPDVVTSNYDMIGATVLLNAGGNKLNVVPSPSPAQYGETVTLNAAVVPTVKGATTPTGTVNFAEGGNVLGSANVVNGSANIELSSLTPGDHTINTVYSGSSVFMPSSGAVSITVNKAATTTTVTSSANPGVTGNSVTFTATVTPTTTGAPTGTVTFMDGDTSLGTGTLDASGKASLSTTSLTTATHGIAAVYGGDANYVGSTSATLSQVVNDLAATSVALTSSANPVATGKPVTFTATVTSTTTGAITGTVTFNDGAISLGTGTLDPTGKATLSTSSLTTATHSITAVYGGDTNYVGSTSATLNQVVNDLAATSVVVTSSTNPVVTGKSVTFTASVTSSVSGAITGTVTFMDGATSFGTGTLDASGKATLSTTSLTTATHSITAVYGGDTSYAGSTSTALSQVVLATAPDYTLVANPATATVTAGGSATFTITATADQYFNGTVTFSCGQLPTGVACNFSPASLTPTNGHLAQSTLVVTTTSERAALTLPASPVHGRGVVLFASLSGIGVFGGLFLGNFSRRQRRCMMILFVALMVLAMVACGGSSKTNPNGTPVGQSTVQVSATATAGTTGGNTSPHPVSVTINVQK